MPNQGVEESTTVALSTLTNATGILLAGPVMTEPGRMISSTIAAAIRDLTAGDGPFLWGVASKNLSLSELEAYLENAGPVRGDDNTKVEISSRGRLTRVLGVLAPSGSGTQAIDFLRNFPLKGLSWSEESAGWQWWVYNLGNTLTAGAFFHVVAQNFVSWL